MIRIGPPVFRNQRWYRSQPVIDTKNTALKRSRTGMCKSFDFPTAGLLAMIAPNQECAERPRCSRASLASQRDAEA
jgi:hypothetical protein